MRGEPDFGVNLAALCPQIAAKMVVKFHFHPSDLDALMTHFQTEQRSIVESLLPSPWLCGSIEVHLGHPVRQGIVRAERSDGTFEIIDITRAA